METIKRTSDTYVVTAEVINGQSVERTYTADEWAAKERGDEAVATTAPALAGTSEPRPQVQPGPPKKKGGKNNTRPQ